MTTTHPNMFLELRLYDNGIDFINKSMESFVRAVEDPSPVEYKYAITLLATGCELILKSLLENIHPLFIEENIDSSAEKTVSADNLISRINKIYNYEQPKKRIQKLDIDNLNSIRSFRNKIIHKEAIFNDEKVPQNIYANALFSLDRIVKDFKQLTLSSQVNNWTFIANIEPIQTAYYNSIEGIKLNGIPVPCSVCSIKKLIKKDEKVECLHCGSIFMSLPEAINSLDDVDLIEELFVAFSFEKHMNGMHFRNCPNCNGYNMAWYEKDKKTTVCFNCGPVISSNCNKCNEDSLIIYSHDINGNIEEVRYCFVCDENIDSDTCPNCFHGYYKLREKLKIDIKITKDFYSNVSLETTSSPFIEVALCPSCYDYMHELEQEGIIEII